MKTKWVVTIIVAVFASAVSIALAESRPVENELQKRFDRNRDGQLDDREQAQLEEFNRTTARAERLRSEAKEHEEIARKLRAESEELARNLDRQLQTPPPESPDRTQADKAAAELRQSDQGLRDQQRARMKEKADQLLEQAQKAKQQGRHDQANQLLAESERITRRLQTPDSKPGPEEFIRNLHDRLQELDEASDRAAQSGNPARAQALRQQADQARRDLDAANRRTEAGRLRNEIRQLGEQADKAQADGNREKAAAIRKEAAALKQRMPDLAPQPRPDRQRRLPYDPFEPFPGQMAPYPQRDHYPQRYQAPQRFSPYGYQPYGRQMTPEGGLPLEIEQLRQQVFQLRQMMEEFYQLAGEDPGY
jgi:hypothetical protein